MVTAQTNTMESGQLEGTKTERRKRDAGLCSSQVTVTLEQTSTNKTNRRFLILAQPGRQDPELTSRELRIPSHPTPLRPTPEAWRPEGR